MMNDFIQKALFALLLGAFVGVAIFNYELVKISVFGFKTFEIPLFLVIFCSFLIGSVFNLTFLFSFKKK